MIEVSLTPLTKYEGTKIFIVKNQKKIEEWKERAKHCGMLCKIEIREITNK